MSIKCRDKEANTENVIEREWRTTAKDRKNLETIDL